MILKRELYDLVPWGVWLRRRAGLQWARLTGGMARQIGVREDVISQVAPEAGAAALPRAVPVPGARGVRSQLLAATALCPTGAFFSDDAAKCTVLRRASCITCGLCYAVAPDALAPGPQDGPFFAPGPEELIEFRWE